MMKGWIQVWYIVRTSVNVTMYPQHNNNNNKILEPILSYWMNNHCILRKFQCKTPRVLKHLLLSIILSLYTFIFISYAWSPHLWVMSVTPLIFATYKRYKVAKKLHCVSVRFASLLKCIWWNISPSIIFVGKKKVILMCGTILV
jgi:hypothetical protein